MTEHPAEEALPVSVIICSRDRPLLMYETVQSILQGERVPAELVIVDQSASPNEQLGQLVADLPSKLRYLWSDTTGLSRARNIAIRAATYDDLLFTDDDMFVASDWVSTLARELQRGDSKTILTGQVLPGSGQEGGFQLSLRVDEARQVYEGRTQMDVLLTGNMAFRRSVMDEVGSFDERLGAGTAFPGAEDKDMGWRLLEAGYRIVYLPEAVVYHRQWRTGREYFGLWWAYGISQGAFYTKHLSLTDRHMLRRMVGDIRHRAYTTLRQAYRDPRRALGAGLNALGIISGAVRWRLAYGRTK